MDLDNLARQLATGLARMAVAVQAAGDPVDDAAAGTDVAPRTLVQQQVLLVLARRRPQLALRALAAELGLTVATALAALSDLQRDGLVSMGPTPSYSPAEMLVSLTDRGLAQAPQVRHWAGDLLAAIDDLGAGEQARLLEIVIRHIQLMQRRDQIPVTRMCVTCRYFDGYAHPGSAAPHHCLLVDAPFGHRELRLRCPDQEGADQPAEVAAPGPAGGNPGQRRKPPGDR